MLSHLLFSKIRILNIQWAVVLQWCSTARQTYNTKQASYIANVS